MNQQSQKGFKESKYNKKLERFNKLVPNQFRFHIDTSQLAKNIHILNTDQIVCITDKWHGTSAVFSNLLINKQLKWYERLAKRLGLKIIDKEYGNLYSSRSVIKNKYINKEVTPGYYNEDIWGVVNNEIKDKIEEGITLYGEIVGYLESGKYIQKGYDYGCKPNEHKFLVYRITYTKPNGSVIEFTWQQIQSYCKRYKLEYVKELFYGKVRSLYDYLSRIHSPVITGEFDTSQAILLDLLGKSFNLEQNCTYCTNKVPAEGIVLRIDGQDNYSAFKLKSKKFLKRESDELDSGEINIEDSQNIEQNG